MEQRRNEKAGKRGSELRSTVKREMRDNHTDPQTGGENDKGDEDNASANACGDDGVL